MESFVKCYDIVSMVVDEASSQYAPTLTEDEESRSILKEYCEAIDLLYSQYDTISYDASVNDITKNITVKIECVVFDVASINKTEYKIFYDLVRRSVSVNFFTSKDINTVTVFEFPSIWKESSNE